MDDALVALTFVTALGCGLSAGALFAFSSFVMKALARLPAAQGIAAMQSINVVAVTPVHDGAVRNGRGVRRPRRLGARRLARLVRAWLLAGSALYLAGTIGLTMAYHVPRNNALAAVEPTRHAEARWRRYVADWTRGNHVRVAAGLAAAAALTEALHVG